MPLLPPFVYTFALRAVLVVAVVAFLWGWGYKDGSEHVQTKWDAAVTQAAIRTVKIIEYRDRWREKIVERVKTVTQTIETTTANLQQEVAHEAQEHPRPDLVFSATDVVRWNTANNLSAPAGAASGTQTDGQGASVVEALGNHIGFAGDYCAPEIAKYRLLWLWAQGLQQTEQAKEATP